MPSWSAQSTGPFTSAPMESSFSGGPRNLEPERSSGLGSGRMRRKERWPEQRTRASRLSRGGGQLVGAHPVHPHEWTLAVDAGVVSCSVWILQADAVIYRGALRSRRRARRSGKSTPSRLRVRDGSSLAGAECSDGSSRSGRTRRIGRLLARSRWSVLYTSQIDIACRSPFIALRVGMNSCAT